MNTVQEVLQGMDDLLSDESKWTKGSVARKNGGQQANTNDADAVCWCLLGAAGYFCHDNQPLFEKTRDALLEAAGLELISPWNDLDTTTFQQVKDLIAKAKAQV